MENIYFTYRRNFTDRGVMQDLSFYNDKQYADYKAAGLTNMIDGERFIPDDKFIKEIVPGVLDMRIGGVMEYNEALDGVELANNIKTTSESFATIIMTAEEIADWIRISTSCVEEILTEEEIAEGILAKYLTREAVVDLPGEDRPAEYLIIK